MEELLLVWVLKSLYGVCKEKGVCGLGSRVVYKYWDCWWLRFGFGVSGVNTGSDFFFKFEECFG